MSFGVRKFWVQGSSAALSFTKYVARIFNSYLMV